MTEKSKLNRRAFVKASAVGVVAASIPLSGCNDDDDPVVDDDETTEEEDDTTTDSEDGDVKSAVAQAMIDESIMQLTGETEVGAAWKSLMPDITTSSVIAIKVNCRSEALPTHPEVTYAVAAGLAQMDIDGGSFPENNIHIYDNFKSYLTESGYTENSSSEGVQCYQETDHSSESYSINGISQKICSLVHDTADYLINIGVLKNHSSMAGVTLCMKNHFGSIDNPRILHVNYGDPYIGALNAIEPIFGKQVLAILDGVLGAAEGGPYGAATFVENKIIMSQDTVAVDYLGREILREQESSTVEWATYIDSAADYGIGTNDPEKMEIVTITNPSTDNTIETTAASSGETLCRVVVAVDEDASNV